MRLHWIVTCSSYEPQADGTVDILGAGVDEFWVDDLPTELTIQMFARLGLLAGEEDLLRIELLAPDTTMIGVLDMPMFGNAPPHHRPGHEIVLMQPINVTFPAEQEGIYSAEIFTDTGRTDSVFFAVRVGQPPY